MDVVLDGCSASRVDLVAGILLVYAECSKGILLSLFAVGASVVFEVGAQNEFFVVGEALREVVNMDELVVCPRPLVTRGVLDLRKPAGPLHRVLETGLFI